MATISITDIVSDNIDGTGSFDKLMSAVEIRLKAQYDAGRITGSDFANVYLGVTQSVLQQSIAYTLGVQQADKQADLITEQTNLVTEQIASSQATTTRNDSIGAKQVLKGQAETDLLDQKKLTEQAQILDTVDGNAVAGIIGKQKTLYTNQADGFTRDAEQKTMKAFSDIWTIAKSTSPDDLELALPLNVDQHSMDVMLGNLAINSGLVANQSELGTPAAAFSSHTVINAVDPGSADIIITTNTAHGMSTGQAISISGISGMTELNGNSYIVTSTGSTTFTLNDTDAVVGTTYISGGTVRELV